MTPPLIGYMRAPPGRSAVRTPSTRRSSWRRSSSLTCTSRGTAGTRWRARSTWPSGRWRSGSRTGGWKWRNRARTNQRTSAHANTRTRTRTTQLTALFSDRRLWEPPRISGQRTRLGRYRPKMISTNSKTHDLSSESALIRFTFYFDDCGLVAIFVAPLAPLYCACITQLLDREGRKRQLCRRKRCKKKKLWSLFTCWHRRRNGGLLLTWQPRTHKHTRTLTHAGIHPFFPYF